MAALIRLVRLWWRQADGYEQLSAHLEARGLTPLARALACSSAALLGLLSFGSLWTGTGGRSEVEAICVFASCVAAASCAAIWALHWPTRGQSTWSAILASLGIALAAFGQSNLVAALVACTAFPAIAAYIAAFHTPRLIMLNFAIAAVTASVKVVSSANATNFFAACSAFAIILLLISAIPAGIQILVRVLGTDAARAEYDQLTGLLNRAGFYRRAEALANTCDTDASIAIALIDLDRFKQLNDRYGHRHGDEALVAVADAIRRNSSESAVIGRVGGEEFVLAGLWFPHEVHWQAGRLCAVIAELPFQLTASIGTVAHRFDRSSDFARILTDLIASADAAMYQAKQGGGNQTFQLKKLQQSSDINPLGLWARDRAEREGGMAKD